MQLEGWSGLEIFRLVARESSFTRAAKRLGVTQSALSQAMKRLEAELGIRLLDRTTRSVSPTAAGTRLLATLDPAFSQVEAALTAITEMRDQPAGRIRVTAGRHAADTVLMPAIARLVSKHREIQVEASVDNGYVDIVAERFDAGIRMGERLEGDMIAMPVSPPLRMAVVASPAYWAQAGRPDQPGNLRDHRCITFRNRDYGVAPWTFEQGGRELAVKVGGGPIFDDASLMREAAIAGLGPTFLIEDQVADALQDGRLDRVLADWCESFAGYYLYYSSRRQPTQAFSLFVEALRVGRSGVPTS